MVKSLKKKKKNKNFAHYFLTISCTVLTWERKRVQQHHTGGPCWEPSQTSYNGSFLYDSILNYIKQRGDPRHQEVTQNQ